MVSIALNVELPEGYALYSLNHTRYGCGSGTDQLKWSVTVCRPADDFPYAMCFGVGQHADLQVAFNDAFEESKWKFETKNHISKIVFEEMQRRDSGFKSPRPSSKVLPSAEEFF